ncbi:hypothetical protein [Alienimonas californiensis]|uniref:O-Antigen ligase n=1 Tax=Alienimonas californiensis TaxID=2527989 RepID=A0A517P7Y3_9PLAN|nr:hypothetical protein [Alienimonas californiensis]QDT15481.1 hypothetical protein CA12_15660 [Alienimonas californiensis]
MWLPLALTLFPAILILPGTQSLRLPLRMLSYGIAAAPAAWYGVSVLGRRAHPSAAWLAATFALLSVMILHPTTNGLLVAMAQIGLYAAVAAPLFWMPRVRTGPEDLSRSLLVFLGCVGVNSAVGVLQVYAPDTFMPAEFSRVVTESEFGLDGVSYEGPDGRRIIRPPGLFDSPGAVSGAGMVAGIFGLAALMDGRSLRVRATGALFALCGLAAILLTQVRTALAVLAGMVVVYFGVMLMRGRVRQVAWGASLGGVAAAAGVAVAFTLGGTSVSGRFATLLDDDPASVFANSSRGGFVRQALTEQIFDYPVGAGLGRWGMMRRYFGNPYNFSSPPIWAETNLNGWILDGGVPLLLLNLTALGALFAYLYRTARRHPAAPIRQAATLVLAVCAGWSTMITSYTPFCSTLGIQFWFLAGLICAAENSYRDATAKPAAPKPAAPKPAAPKPAAPKPAAPKPAAPKPAAPKPAAVRR